MSWTVITACNDDKKTSAVDSSAALHTPTIQPATPATNTGWDTTEAGPVMLLAGPENPASAAVVLPWLSDSALASAPGFMLDSLSSMPVDLFDPAGLAGSSSLLVNSQKLNTEGCVSWPTGSLSSPPREWRFGLRKGIASAIPLDSLEGMSPTDSSQVTVEIARIASAVAEGSDPVFRGLPFAVRHAYRFALGNNSVLTADVVRKINEEANPREEHLLLIAERAPGADEKYSAVFQSRVAGSEEAVRTNEILGAVKFIRGRAAIVVTFEYEDGGKVALLERTGDKQWRITWKSAYTGC
ncbi:MAG: hypothetical protein ABI556_00140 [Gemmatimonadales bacterium]